MKSFTLFFTLCIAVAAQARPLPTRQFACLASNKQKVIKLYPNPSFDGRIYASTTQQQLHLYIFDVQGTMLQQAALKPKTKQRIATLPKGVYVYDVFRNDESIEYGKLEVK